jgi:hypothetical protein
MRSDDGGCRRHHSRGPAVSYVLEDAARGGRVRSQNLNVYLVQNGKCFDIHLSRTASQPQSEQELLAIAASFVFEPTK